MVEASSFKNGRMLQEFLEFSSSRVNQILDQTICMIIAPTIIEIIANTILNDLGNSLAKL